MAERRLDLDAMERPCVDCEVGEPHMSVAQAAAVGTFIIGGQEFVAVRRG